jgi:HEAT repeat protein
MPNRGRISARSTRGRVTRVLLSVLVPVLVSGLAACGETSRRTIKPEDDLYNPSPARRTEAVSVVRTTRDTQMIPVLIEMLDDEDAGVRLAASVALRDLTGRDTGYEPWADADARRAQVLAWRAWWQQSPASTVRPSPRSPTRPLPPPPPVSGAAPGESP